MSNDNSNNDRENRATTTPNDAQYSPLDLTSQSHSCCSLQSQTYPSELIISSTTTTTTTTEPCNYYTERHTVQSLRLHFRVPQLLQFTAPNIPIRTRHFFTPVSYNNNNNNNNNDNRTVQLLHRTMHNTLPQSSLQSPTTVVVYTAKHTHQNSSFLHISFIQLRQQSRATTTRKDAQYSPLDFTSESHSCCSLRSQTYPSELVISSHQ